MSRHRKTAVIALSVLWVMLLVAWVAAITGKPVDIDRTGVEEPSGLVYHTGRGTLFAVGDQGKIYEMRTDGRPVKQKDLAEGGWLDLEGVTFDPSTGLLYVAVEGKERILEVDPETLAITREWQIPRTWKGRTVLKAGGQGIEGIAFLPDANHPQGGTFLVSNQGFRDSPPEDASVLVRVELPLRAGADAKVEPKILGCTPMNVYDLSDLCYDTLHKRLYAISDSGNRVYEITPEGKILKDEPLPGENQEGFAADAEGFVYIAQDSGGILKLKPGR
ncbi:MAG TPA: esterase-like activity of phytase family protein [Planctomycetota bacterium]|nr:esterase-like activity of phytase family protein [Planctomycetota bacterium]HUV39096.1 esterase-like activity of phytase family protein [Planctomycetota bacterium]